MASWLLLVLRPALPFTIQFYSWLIYGSTNLYNYQLLYFLAFSTSWAWLLSGPVTSLMPNLFYLANFYEKKTNNIQYSFTNCTTNTSYMPSTCISLLTIWGLHKKTTGRHFASTCSPEQATCTGVIKGLNCKKKRHNQWQVNFKARVNI